MNVLFYAIIIQINVIESLSNMLFMIAGTEDMYFIVEYIYFIINRVICRYKRISLQLPSPSSMFVYSNIYAPNL